MRKKKKLIQVVNLPQTMDEKIRHIQRTKTIVHKIY